MNKNTTIEISEDETNLANAVASVALDLPTGSAYSLRHYAIVDDEELDLTELTNKLRESLVEIRDGDLSRGQTMLGAQAELLNGVFNKLLLRAAANSAEGYLGATEIYLKLAMKAQGQCKATWETLAVLEQRRISAGDRAPETVHSEVRVHIVDPKNEPNELLEGEHGEWLEHGAADASGTVDSQLAAVEAVNRPQVG